ncbi:TIGR03545 family protein [Stieleria varia]|uniref:AsmA family protein n=1 Tax=Stieleria varia TaxID=2528005 RepID=A0A5C6AQQ5_9BACT|nr:TIGR03545 family protein [Stieleria varia]TWU01312.1 hypothetical protein Pla52n_46860 [Stieleria varia]
MIRWRFLITRVVIVVAVLTLLALGLGPVAHFATVQSLQSATGAKVSIENTRIGLFPPSVTYTDLRLADPRDGKEMQDIVRAESVELEIDGNALLRRRWVARTGRITGLQVGAKRETSGQFDTEEPESASDVPAGPGMLSQLLRGLGDDVSDQAESIGKDLETVKRSREIRTRWENHYAQSVARAKRLKEQIREISDQAKGIDNPLRDYLEVQRTIAKMEEARRELVVVRQQIDMLPEQLQLDFASLDEAKRIDLAKVDEYVPGNLSDSKNFGVDLVTNAVKDQINRVREIYENGRSIANYTVVAPETERIRGEDFDFLGANRKPSLLIRECSVSGLMRVDGNPYQVKGTIKDITPTPQWSDDPLTAQLVLDGPELLEVSYMRDRRNGGDVDLVTLHWPAADARTMKLGGNGDAAITIDGGKRDLWVQLKIEGENVAGRMQSKQTDVHVDMTVDSKYANLAATKSIQRSLAEIDQVTIEAGFGGTWSDMELKMHTNLGGVLNRAANDAVNDQIAATRRAVVDKVESVHNEQTKALREWFAQQQSEARDMVAKADTLAQEVLKKVVADVGDNNVYIGGLKNALDRLR